MPDEPTKLCECGCGRPAPLATSTWARGGHVKGEPLRFVRGHSTRVSPRWMAADCGHATPCHVWRGATTKGGYGYFWQGGHQVRAHRQAWVEAHGPIPDGLIVCHACDNPPCVNVEHLFLGTSAQNTSDMVSKGRQPHGERKPGAKLTPADVAAIRAATGVTQRALATQYGVAPVTIWNIRAGRRWTHL